MGKLILDDCIQTADNQFVVAFMSRIVDALKPVNWRKLFTMSTILLLSALLSACSSGGGGGGGGNASAPVPTLSVSSSTFSIDEDFATVLLVATATNATEITVNQSTSGITANQSTSGMTANQSTSGMTVNQSTTELITVVATSNSVSVSSLLNANGRTTLTITASNGGNNVSTEVLVIVNPINDTPTLTVPTTALTIAEDFATTTVISVTTNDVDGDTLTISVSHSDSGVVNAMATTNAVILTSIANANGQTTLTITVNDGNIDASTQVAVTVDAVADTLTFSIPNANLIENEDFLGVRSVGTINNVDGDTLTVSVTQSTPEVVTVTTSALGIFISNLNNANGRTTLTITANNGRENISTQVAVLVNDVNDTPTLTIPTTTLIFSEDFAGASTAAIAMDVEGNTLTISVAQSTPEVVVVTTSASIVRVSNLADANGRSTLTISVSDGMSTNSTQLTVVVEPVNDTPTLSVSTYALTLIEDFVTTVPITVMPDDVDGDTVTISVTQSTPSVVSAVATSNAILVSSIANANGRTTLTITINDGNVDASTEVAVTVITANDTPTLSVSVLGLTLMEDFTTIVPITVGTDDIDGDSLTISVTQSTSGVVNAIATTTGVNVSSIGNANGRTTLTISVSDGLVNASTQVSVTVIATNDTPTLSVTPSRLLNLTEDFATTIQITVTTNDIDGDTLTISLVEFITGVVNAVRTTTGFEVTSIANANGVTVLTIWVNDGMSTVSMVIPVQVAPVNDPPTLIISTATLNVAEDFAGDSTVVTAFDVDRTDFVRLSVIQSIPAVVSVKTSAAGVQVSRIENANGRSTLSITASDGSLNTTTEVAVIVSPVNDTPTISVSTTALTLNEDFVITFPITVTTDDIDGNTLTLTVAESTTGVVRVTTSASGINVSSILNANGRTTLTISVSDGSVNASTQVTVTINPINDAPTFNISTTRLTLVEDFTSTVQIIVTANDVDNDPLTIRVVEFIRDVVKVTTSDTGVDVTSVADVFGVTVLTILVSDGSFTASFPVSVSISAVNDTPTLTIPTSTLTFTEDFAGTSTIATASDVDRRDRLNISVTQSTPEVVRVSASAAGVQVSNLADAHGQSTLNISVNDGTVIVSTQVVVQVIATNDTPTLSVTTTALTLTEDFSTTVPITITMDDVDGDTLTLNVLESTTGVIRVTTSDSAVNVSSIADAYGRTTLTISISDSSLSATTQVVVQVTATNDTPTLTVLANPLILNEDFIGTRTVVTAIDVDGTTLTLSVVESTTGVVSFTTSAVGVQVSNVANANGRTTLTITASDSSLSVTTQVVMIVNAINDTPTVNVSFNALMFLEDFSTTTIRVFTSDVEGDTLTLSVTHSTPGVVNTTIRTISGVTFVEVSSIPNAHGQTLLTFTLSDSEKTASAQVPVTVRSVNDPPTLMVSTTAILVFEDFATTIPITITRSDVENENLSLSLTESTTGVVRVTTSVNGYDVSSIANASGQTTLTITINDGTNSVSTQVTVTVIGDEDAPVINISTTDLTLTEDFGTTEIRVVASDSDGDVLTIRVVQFLLGVANATISSSGILVTNIPNANGLTILSVIVNDGTINVTTQVILTVTAVNDPPELTITTPNLIVAEDFAVATTVASATDVDRDPLTFSVTQSSTGVVAVTTSDSGVQISKIQNANGRTTLTISVSDSLLTATTVVRVTVTEVNDPPNLTVTSLAITLAEDFPSSISIPVMTDDVEGDTLTLSVTQSTPMIVTITTASTSVVRFSSKKDANGRSTLTIVVNDGTNIVSTQVIVVVTAVPDTPTISVLANPLILNEDFGFSTIATALDVDGDTVTFNVTNSTDTVVNFTTSNTAVRIASIKDVFGRSTLTISATDGTLTATTQVVAIVNPINDTPTISVSTNAITLDEDFSTTQTIALTLLDVDNATLTYSVVESTTGLIKVTTAASEVRISSIANANGRTTLSITVSDSSLSSTALVPVTVNAVNDTITLTLSTSFLTLSALSDQLDRNIQDISISNIDKVALGFQIISSGSPIFSSNPTPVVSFTTNALTTITTENTVVSTAQLYFSIAPGQTGTATLTVRLSSLSRSETTQQTMVVQVHSVAVPPVVIKNSTNLENFVVHGGHLYAMSVVPQRPIAPFLAEAQRSGGHLININTIEELNFVNTTASGFVISNPWIGMHVPNIVFPGELYWVTNDSTIAYGYANANAGNNPTVYPGHYALPWNPGDGLVANRGSSRPFSRSNWTVYTKNSNTFFLLGNTGDTTVRHALYEFPNGIAAAPINSVTVGEGTSTIARLTGYDLNGDAISTSNWSGVDQSNGTVIIRSVTQRSGAETVDVEYVSPLNFSGQTTVVVTLQVNGLSTSSTIPFTVDRLPVITLSTNTISLREDFSTMAVTIGVTDLENGFIPYSVQPSSTGIVTITTSASTIQLSSVLNANGVVTLSIQATDSLPQTVSTEVVVTVIAVNDTPTINVSTNDITTLGGFEPIYITGTANDVEDSSQNFVIQASRPGVVSFNIIGNSIILSPVETGSGRTTLTVIATDTGNKTATQTIAVNVLVSGTTIPVLAVSTNRIVLQEDFASITIRTTASDAGSDTLTITVSAFNRVIETEVFLPQGIILRPLVNVFGQTTLTVRATDPGGLFDSEEIVVDVLSVNDTPTISLSTNTVILDSDPFMLTFSATDVEGQTLTKQVSTNHNFINTTLTDSLLTITRIGLDIAQYMLTLSVTDSGGAQATTIVTVVLPSLLVITTGVKIIDFTWSRDSNATHYQLQSNPDGNSGFTDLSTTGIVVSPNSTNIIQTTAQGFVALHRYIPRVSDPFYMVRTCNILSCQVSPNHNPVGLSNAELTDLIGRLVASNSGGSSQFGESVSISADGNTLAVGAIGDDSSSTGINSVPTNNDSNSGAVYVFRRNGGIWTQQAYIKASNADPNDNFGRSVSLSADGNSLAVGVPFEASIATGINGAQNNNSGFQVGAVYLFRFNASSNSWLQQAYIKASNAGIPDRFGLSVAISDDGNTLAVGAPLEGSSSMGINGPKNDGSSFSGAAYIFRFSTSTNAWFQQAFVKASNTGGSDNFGISVSLNTDGNTLAVGASSEAGPSNNLIGSGAAYVFRSDGSNWSQQAYIKATNASIGDNFGLSLSLNDDGNTLAVSAPFENSSSTGINSVPNNNTTNTGAVYVFQFNSSGVWTQQAYIKASNPDEEDKFGGSMSLSRDGNTLVVGAINEDGSATGIEGIDNNTINSDNAGAAYVFEFINGQWVQQAYVKNVSNAVNAHFGSSVSISGNGDTVVVGADGVGSNDGQVYLY